MKIAIISDIHGNLEALTAAFRVIETKGIKTVYCLGDIVGYGANPGECIDLLLRHNARTVVGNHDRALFDKHILMCFNRNAKHAIEWTHQQLTEAQKNCLESLPYVLTEGDSTFVHASPLRPEEWDYLMSERDAIAAFPAFSTPLCWIGHTHVPDVFTENAQNQVLERGRRFIVNVGSIGQPRDHDSRLSFCIFDTDDWSMEHIREEYDIASARKKIIDAGLPRWLGDRLVNGS
ncbi:MAG: metallophosphoesterase family protein [Ignavibacteriales bacterium]|nr:metallophosphoesterase family protein [Ignavibacteriales bacterium]